MKVKGLKKTTQKRKRNVCLDQHGKKASFFS